MDIRLGSIDVVKDFVNTVNRIEGEVFLSSGRYVIDAKYMIVFEKRGSALQLQHC